jgi:hypothetical protein
MKNGKARQRLELFCKGMVMCALCTNYLNPIDKTSKFTPKAWASLIKLVKKQSIVLGDLLKELSDLYANDTILKAHKKATLSVWLPLLKTLASFNSICPLIPYFQVCMIVL